MNEIKFLVKLKDIVQNDIACSELGLNPYCVREGSGGEDDIELTADQFKRFGFLSKLYNEIMDKI
jgi:hypothetical protein